MCLLSTTTVDQYSLDTRCVSSHDDAALTNGTMECRVDEKLKPTCHIPLIRGPKKDRLSLQGGAP